MSPVRPQPVSLTPLCAQSCSSCMPALCPVCPVTPQQPWRGLHLHSKAHRGQQLAQSAMPAATKCRLYEERMLGAGGGDGEDNRLNGTISTEERIAQSRDPASYSPAAWESLRAAARWSPAAVIGEARPGNPPFCPMSFHGCPGRADCFSDAGMRTEAWGDG